MGDKSRYDGGVTAGTDWGVIVARLGEAMGAPAIADVTRDALARWLTLLAKWKDKTDLTGAKTPEAMVEVMVADAFVLAAMAPRGAVLIDVGAGAGGPAIPLALLRADVKVTMVEPRVRRVAFLRTSIGALALVDRVAAAGASIDAARPTAPPDAFAPIDVAFSRATFAPDVWLPIGLALAPRVIVLSTDPLAPSEARVRLESERRYRWPFSDAPRWAGSFVRSAEAPQKESETGVE